MKLHHGIVVLALLAWTPLHGQDVASDQPNLVAMTAQDAAIDTYREHLIFLAHPALEGRLPGERGCALAEEMISTTFRQLGLDSPESLSEYRDSFEFKQGGRFGSTADSKVVTGNNICAILPGRGGLEDEWVILGAHHDHLGRGQFGSRSPDGRIHEGADDNASGTAAVLLAAELLRDIFLDDDDPRRSILFITFSGEESGPVSYTHLTLPTTPYV